MTFAVLLFEVINISIVCEYYCQFIDQRINQKMSEKRESKKRKCNDKKGKQSSLKVQEIKHEYTIEVLNYHCLGEIISYLGPVDRLNLEKVCEKIKVASNIAWRRIKDLEMTATEYSVMINKECSIKAGGTQSMTKQVLVRCGNHLESLHLGPCGNVLMSSVVDKCHNLRNLTIECQTFDNNNFKDPFKNMKNLKYFKIKLSEHNNVGLLKSLPKDIEEISLMSCNSDFYNEPLLFPKDFETYSNEWKALRSLSLNSLTIDRDTNTIFNKNYPLTHLNLVNCAFVDTYQTGLLLSIYKNLRHLNLEESDSLSTNGLIPVIVNNFENLKYLNLENTNWSLTEDLKELGKLKNLNEINFSDTSTDDGVLAKFKNLKSLNCKMTKVSDTGVIAILDNSPNLERLDLHCTRITANSLSHAAKLTNSREKKLIISADSKVINAFNERNEISPFLFITKHEF